MGTILYLPYCVHVHVPSVIDHGLIIILRGYCEMGKYYRGTCMCDCVAVDLWCDWWRCSHCWRFIRRCHHHLLLLLLQKEKVNRSGVRGEREGERERKRGRGEREGEREKERERGREREKEGEREREGEGGGMEVGVCKERSCEFCYLAWSILWFGHQTIPKVRFMYM